MGGLQTVIRAAGILNGERHAPDLPIPISAIERYAGRFGMSPIFVQLVREYDTQIMAGILGSMNNGSTSSKTPKKLL